MKWWSLTVSFAANYNPMYSKPTFRNFFLLLLLIGMKAEIDDMKDAINVTWNNPINFELNFAVVIETSTETCEVNRQEITTGNLVYIVKLLCLFSCATRRSFESAQSLVVIHQKERRRRFLKHSQSFNFFWCDSPTQSPKVSPVICHAKWQARLKAILEFSDSLVGDELVFHSFSLLFRKRRYF